MAGKEFATADPKALGPERPIEADANYPDFTSAFGAKRAWTVCRA